MNKHQIEQAILALAACAGTIDKRQMKQIYRILIAHGRFPICPACNQPITDINDFSWDHVYPHSCGGSNDLYNLQPMHKICNELKDCKIDSKYINVQYEFTEELRIACSKRKYKTRTSKKNRHVERMKAWHQNEKKNKQH